MEINSPEWRRSKPWKRKLLLDELAAVLAQLDIEIRERSTAEEKLEDAKSFAKRCANSPVGQMIKQLDAVRGLRRYEAVNFDLNTKKVTMNPSVDGEVVRYVDVQAALNGESS